MAKKTLSLEYNSSREDIVFAEYGRSIQNLIAYAKTLDDKARRQAIVEFIVDLIQQLNPQTKNINEYKQKLWRHVFKMAKYDLDVTSPYGEVPTKDEDIFKPKKVEYPQHEFNWRHYGYNIRVMIDKALSMEEGPIKKGYVETILSYMKLSYRTWNKEHFVNDEIIISDLAVMSGNQLSVDDDHTITMTSKNTQPANNLYKSSKQKPKHQKHNQAKSTPNNNNKYKTSKNFKQKPL